MTERSLMWATGLYGDGLEAYEQADFAEMLRAVFTSDDYTTRGVLYGYLNELAVTSTSSPLSVATGAAMVNGLFYANDAVVSVTVATPTTGTTGHRVVLQAIYGVTQTVRIALISSADGTATIPSVTQTDGVKWEISLATLTITTGGVITVTDARAYLYMPTMLATENYDADSVDDTKVGNRVLVCAKRQGGSATAWATAGITNYDVTMCRMQCGQYGGVAAATSGTVAITFPVAFSDTPIAIIIYADNPSSKIVLSGITTAAGLTAYWKGTANPPANVLYFSWWAIGPE